MKNLIQAALDKAQEGHQSSFDEMVLTYYYQQEDVINALRNAQGRPGVMIKRMDTLTYLMGLTLRMWQEGYDPLKALNCTEQERAIVSNAYDILRNKLTAAKPKTLTTTLYHAIVAAS